MLILRLATKPGQRVSGAADVYYVCQRRGEFVLQSHDLAPRSFATLAKLAHCLGGIVPWEQWSDEAQVQLDYLKLRGAF